MFRAHVPRPRSQSNPQWAPGLFPPSSTAFANRSATAGASTGGQVFKALAAGTYFLVVDAVAQAAIGREELAARGESRTEPFGADSGRMQGAAKRRILEVFKRAATQQPAPSTPERRRGDFCHGLLGRDRNEAPGDHLVAQDRGSVD